MRLIKLIGLMGLVFLLSLTYLAGLPGKPIASSDTFDSPFGLIGNTAAQASELNAFWTKLVIPWQLVQPAEAEFNFGVIDQELERIGPINVVGLIKANAPWAVSCRHFVGLANSCPPRNANDYARFLHELVSRYSDRIQVWQIEDEVYSQEFYGGSQEDYLGMLETAALVIRGANKNHQVMVSSTNLSPGKPYRERLTRVLGQDQLYDIIDLHLAGTETEVEDKLVEFQKLIADLETNKPIWVTELRADSRELLKLHGLVLGSGVKKVFWFDALDELSRKSYSLMASLLTNYSISSIVPADLGLHGALFDFEQGRPVALLWSDEDREFDSAKLVAGRVSVLDRLGRRVATKGNKGKLRLTKETIYLIADRFALPVADRAPSGAAKSATLLITLADQVLTKGSTIPATITLNEGRAANLVELQMSFPSELVRARRVDHSSSDFSLVLTETIDNAAGSLTLKKARLLSQDKGELEVAKVIFEVVGSGRGELGFGSSDQGATRVLGLSGENLLRTSRSVEISVE